LNIKIIKIWKLNLIWDISPFLLVRRCHPLVMVAGRPQQTKWQSVSIRLSKLGTDISMKLLVMVTRKNVVKESNVLLMRVSWQEQTCSLLPKYGINITDQNMYHWRARSHLTISVWNISICILFIGQYLWSLFHLKQDTHQVWFMTHLLRNQWWLRTQFPIKIHGKPWKNWLTKAKWRISESPILWFSCLETFSPMPDTSQQTCRLSCIHTWANRNLLDTAMRMESLSLPTVALEEDPT